MTKNDKSVMPLCRMLQSQGFGSRKECVRLVWDGVVRIDGAVCTDPNAEVHVSELVFEVAGKSWTYRPQVYLKLWKPVGYECSHSPQHHDSVFSLVPQQFMTRGLKAAGRLDVDTEGLIILTDDGQCIHHISSPKRALLKVYEVHLKHSVDEGFVDQLLEGVRLRGEGHLAVAREAELRDAKTIVMSIDEGRYHQVRRMVAAAGNRVESLRRVSVGGIGLDGLDVGLWKDLTSAELEILGFGGSLC